MHKPITRRMTQKTDAVTAHGRRIAIGMITAAHGISGAVKIKPFTADPANIAHYGKVFTENGRMFAIAMQRVANASLIARLAQVTDRNSAEALIGNTLYIVREQLPPDDAAWYHADLLGAVIYNRPDQTQQHQHNAGTDEAIGEAVAFHNFGAGELVEVALYRQQNRTALLPFSPETRHTIDVAAKRIVLAIDPIWLTEG